MMNRRTASAKSKHERKPALTPSLLRLRRSTVAGLLEYSEDFLIRHEQRGELTPIQIDGDIFYFIDDVRAICLPRSAVARGLVKLKRHAKSGEVVHVSAHLAVQ